MFITHNDLADESFLPLNGYELDITEKAVEGRSSRTCHICFVATEKDRKVQRIFYDNRHYQNNLENLCLDPDRELITREYSIEFISDIMKRGAEDGFFVTYNHPVWSFETKDEYCNYHGMHAMEMVNYGCVTEGYDDRNENIYDQMLRGGEKIYCIATDDNHNKYPIDHPRCDSFGGFTMIKAPKFEYEAITKALVEGDFYASEGPQIKELYFEDGKIYIESSDAARIVMTTANRRYKVACAERVGETINGASFEIIPELGTYVRFTVRDTEGREAYTNAYFLSALI